MVGVRLESEPVSGKVNVQSQEGGKVSTYGGLSMDIYSPQPGTSVLNIFRRMANKNDLASGIVHDLTTRDGVLEDLGDVTSRRHGKLIGQSSDVIIREIIITGR